MATSDQQFSCRTSDGRFGRATDASDNFIGPARITYIQGEGVANSNIKIYDGTDNSGDLVYEANFDHRLATLWRGFGCSQFPLFSIRNLS